MRMKRLIFLVLMSICSMTVCSVGAKFFWNPFDVSVVKVPWLVSVQVHSWHYCVGSIISSQWVLTSAFCTSGKIPESLSIRIGSPSHRNGGQIVKVMRFVQHENYISHTHDFDYSLLELDQSLNYSETIQAVTLPNAADSVEDGTLCMVSGWGESKKANECSASFRISAVPIVNQDNCNKTYESIHEITSQMICAGEKNVGKNICRGDEGGPLICNVKNGANKLIGLVSWSEGCAESNYPGVYARVQTVRSWIQGVTGI